MNKEQEKRLREALGKLSEAQELVQDVADEIQGGYDELNEKDQEGDKGTTMFSQAENLSGAADAIGDVCGTIQDEIG